MNFNMRVKTEVLIKTDTVVSAISLVVTRMFVFIVTIAVFVSGTPPTPYPKRDDVPDRVWTNGETTIDIKNLKDGRKIASISGSGVIADRRRRPSICGYGYSITDAIIEDGVTRIEDNMFSVCNDLTTVEIPNSVLSIGQGAFAFSGLTSVTIPRGVTSIERQTFSNCYYLSSITIPNSVTSIGDGAFASCNSLMSITIPNSVTSIGVQAFSHCKNIFSIINLNSVPPTIGNEAFGHINEYACLYVPKESIDAYRRAECWKEFKCVKDTASVKSDYTYEDGIMFDGDKTRLIRYSQYRRGAYTIPNYINVIGDRAFYDCYYLTSVTIPNGVSYIGEMAFARCNILTTIVIEKTSPPQIHNDSFRYINMNGVCLYVPRSSINIYRRADFWKDFKCIKPLEDAPRGEGN